MSDILHEHLSFYRFVPLTDPEAVAARLRELGTELGGNMLAAPEGLTAAVGGTPAALDAFQAALESEFDGVFKGIHFKRSFCETRPYTLLKVHVKPELVAFGLDGVSGLSDVPASHVAPRDWPALIAREDVVLLDNRNHFEWKLGRFQGAIDPDVRHFRDFPAYVQAHADKWKAAGKKVAMYCTGGIRCEKMGGWMSAQGLEVYQLDGGILGYFEAMGESAAWTGDCFVFDKRIAIDATLHETEATAEQVYGDDPAEAWRLARARRLDPKG